LFRHYCEPIRGSLWGYFLEFLPVVVAATRQIKAVKQMNKMHPQCLLHNELRNLVVQFFIAKQYKWQSLCGLIQKHHLVFQIFIACDLLELLGV
jgi:hypothetical protein